MGITCLTAFFAAWLYSRKLYRLSKTITVESLLLRKQIKCYRKRELFLVILFGIASILMIWGKFSHEEFYYLVVPATPGFFTLYIMKLWVNGRWLTMIDSKIEILPETEKFVLYDKFKEREELTKGELKKTKVIKYFLLIIGIIAILWVVYYMAKNSG